MMVEEAYLNILSDMHRARVIKDITFKKLSEMLDIESIGHLCLIENGKTDPRLSTMLKILDKLDLTLVVVPYSKINKVKESIYNVSE